MKGSYTKYFEFSAMIVDNEGLNIRSLKDSMKAYGTEIDDDINKATIKCRGIRYEV